MIYLDLKLDLYDSGVDLISVVHCGVAICELYLILRQCLCCYDL